MRTFSSRDDTEDFFSDLNHNKNDKLLLNDKLTLLINNISKKTLQNEM